MKKLLFSILLVGAVALTGCESDFLDINKDPNAINDADASKILSGCQYYSAGTFSEGNFLNSNFSSYTQHLTVREVDNYSLIPNYATLGNTWNYCYTYSVNNADKLISMAEENPRYHVHGAMGKTIKAYMFMCMTDLWGDIPYSEYNDLDIKNPKTDSSKDIYNNVLALLKDAKADFEDATAVAAATKPSATADIIYGADLAKWKKLVNTLQLRLLVQSRKAKTDITDWQSTLTALLTEDNFLANGQDFQFPHTTAVSPLDERKPGFLDEYEGGQKGMYINPWLYEHMAGKTYNVTDNPFQGITDPRMPYYFVNQVSSASLLNNATDYRDGGFISILMASNSSYVSSNRTGDMTVVGIYPVGGRYDDGVAGAITPASGTGIAPDKMIMAYSVPFMKAELALAGETTGDARTYFEDGLKAAIYHVNAVSQAAKGSAVVPDLAPGNANVDNFIAAVLAKYDAAADNEKKMEIVMTQKWIANFFNPIEAYNDMRRTGYPGTFKGNAGFAVTPYKQEAAAVPGITPVELKSINPFPRVLYYPEAETSANSNISNGRNVAAYGNVFWDKQ